MCVSAYLPQHMRASGMTAGIYLTLGNLLEVLIYHLLPSVNYLPLIVRKIPTTSGYASLRKWCPSKCVLGSRDGEVTFQVSFCVWRCFLMTTFFSFIFGSYKLPSLSDRIYFKPIPSISSLSGGGCLVKGRTGIFLQVIWILWGHRMPPSLKDSSPISWHLIPLLVFYCQVHVTWKIKIQMPVYTSAVCILPTYTIVSGASFLN